MANNLNELGLGTYTTNCIRRLLKRKGLPQTIESLTQLTAGNLLGENQIAETRLGQIKEALGRKGLSLTKERKKKLPSRTLPRDEIDILDLDTTTKNAIRRVLKERKILPTLANLTNLNTDDLLKSSSIGIIRSAQIKKALAKRGLSLKND